MATAVLSHEETLHWLALRMLPGLGTLTATRLLDRLKSPEAIFRSSVSEMESIGLSPAQARNIASGCSFDDALEQQRKLLAAGVTLISIHDHLYPPRLREIFD